jgi:3-phenylpropionate/trans-cinnamate dioxygenase ferredoxin reductase component
MAHYPYLIIGGGMTAAAAAQGIRAIDPAGKIGIISAEPDPPYNRPPLSKGIWKGDPTLEGIWTATPARGARLHLGRTAQALDPAHKQVIDDQGARYTYDTLLLATGSRPRRLPFPDPGVIYYRTLADYRQLRALADRAEHFAVIGAGFIGTEIAAALAQIGKRVTLLFPGAAIGERIYPRELAVFLNGYYQQNGVDVRPGVRVTGIRPRGRQTVVQTADGPPLVVDGVVAGLGAAPNSELAQAAGLRVANGIVVDATLRTSAPDIFAAGDVACYPDALLGMRRVEHEDQANQQGERAGRAMAGDVQPYQHLPFFYSDLFALGYEAVGDLDARLETVADWRDPYREGVVYYLGNGRVRGILLWNVWDQVPAVRRILAEAGPFTPETLRGRLPVARALAPAAAPAAAL